MRVNTVELETGIRCNRLRSINTFYVLIKKSFSTKHRNMWKFSEFVENEFYSGNLPQITNTQ